MNERPGVPGRSMPHQINAERAVGAGAAIRQTGFAITIVAFPFRRELRMK
jgi:hypothetical protein